MRRLPRRLFTLGTAISLVIAASLTACLIAGYSRTDYVLHERRHLDGARWRYGVWGVASAGGRLIFFRNTGWSDADEAARRAFLNHLGPTPPVWRHHRTTAPEQQLLYFSHDRWWNRVGFEYVEMMNPSGPPPVGVTQRTRHLVIPVVLPLLLTCIPPAVWARRWSRRRRRERSGRCLACGYDLRGTPDRCSECASRMEQ